MKGGSVPRPKWVGLGLAGVAIAALIVAAVVLLSANGPGGPSGPTKADGKGTGPGSRGHETGGGVAVERAAAESSGTATGVVSVVASQEGEGYQIHRIEEIEVISLGAGGEAYGKVDAPSDGDFDLELGVGEYAIRWKGVDAGEYSTKVLVKAGGSETLDLRRFPVMDYVVSPPFGRVRVDIQRDVFGSPVSGVRVWTKRRGSRVRFRETNGEGWALFLTPPGELRVWCGLHEAVVKVESGATAWVRVPDLDAERYGELVTSPSGWMAKISLVGQNTWREADVVDPSLGRRFLFCSPGQYEVAYPDGTIAGKAVVSPGKRSRFQFDKTAAIAVQPALPESLSDSYRDAVPFVLSGLSRDASHRDGYRLLWMPVAGSGAVWIYGLEPGEYRLECKSSRFQYSKDFELKGGEVLEVDAELALKQ